MEYLKTVIDFIFYFLSVLFVYKSTSKSYAVFINIIIVAHLSSDW